MVVGKSWSINRGSWVNESYNPQIVGEWCITHFGIIGKQATFFIPFTIYMLLPPTKHPLRLECV